jgi:ribose 5-phosphate isomerase B
LTLELPIGCALSAPTLTRDNKRQDDFIYNGACIVRSVITYQDIPPSGELQVPLGTVITPSARDLAGERGVKIVVLPADQIHRMAAPEKTVAIGADHGGFQLKEQLKPVLTELGLAIRDVGVVEETPADYPDIAEKVAEIVASAAATRGVIIDGAGIGSAMAANKVPGVRAALCYDKASARNSREHNDSNVLTLGGRLLTRTQAEEVLRVWLGTPFGGGRHAGRVAKIAGIERKYSK